jgi:hypothetical protein
MSRGRDNLLSGRLKKFWRKRSKNVQLYSPKIFVFVGERNPKAREELNLLNSIACSVTITIRHDEL